jgi:hypothetical protein
MHIGTVPLVNRSSPSALRAHLDHNEVVYVKPAQYHGSPDQDKKSLVTIDWGFDLCRHIFEACGLFTHLLKIDDLSHGIRAEFIEVFVTVKPRRSGSRLLKSSTFEPARLSGGLFPVGKGRFCIEAAADIPTMQAALAISPLFDAAWYLRSYPGKRRAWIRSCTTCTMEAGNSKIRRAIFLPAPISGDTRASATQGSTRSTTTCGMERREDLRSVGLNDEVFENGVLLL